MRISHTSQVVVALQLFAAKVVPYGGVFTDMINFLVVEAHPAESSKRKTAANRVSLQVHGPERAEETKKQMGEGSEPTAGGEENGEKGGKKKGTKRRRDSK